MRLILPKLAVRRLEAAGVYCQTWVTAERQARSGRWVLRGVESGGGGAAGVGRYISFFSLEGNPLPWLQKLDRIGANGAHAVVVIACELVSVEMARVGQTYQLLIARHELGDGEGSRKPPVASQILFRSVDGQLPPELVRQGLTPEFLSRSGEVKPIPEMFRAAVRAVTAGVSCLNCRHCHGLIEPTVGPSDIPEPEPAKPIWPEAETAALRGNPP